MRKNRSVFVCVMVASVVSLMHAEGMRKFRNNKLWRDKAVEFMEDTGCRVAWRRLDDAEFDSCMRRKLLEEAQEVVDAKTRQDLVLELADLQETIQAVAEIHGISPDEIDVAQAKKRAERGGYAERRFVEYAECPVGGYGEKYCLADPVKYPEIIEE